jgi:hypothetical protein
LLCLLRLPSLPRCLCLRLRDACRRPPDDADVVEPDAVDESESDDEPLSEDSDEPDDDVRPCSASVSQHLTEGDSGRGSGHPRP